MKSMTENLLLWEQLIKERTQSRLTIEEWCEKNGITKCKYYYWNRRVREKRKSDEEIAFADITQTLSNNDIVRQNPVSAGDFQIFFNSIQVTVPSNFNPTALTGLMKVLKAL